MTGRLPPRLARVFEVLEARAGLRFLLAFVVIVALKWQTLFEPPVWDTAMGLFPAALTLAANHFNVLDLLAMPTYFQGGPNTHSLSPVTFLTAVVLKATGGGGQEAFAVLHVIHFAVAALSLVALFALAKLVVRPVAAALLCIATLLFPIFSTQVGYTYLEVPLFLCAVCALGAWIDRRFWLAIAWATMAFAIKETGIVVPATLATATLLEDRGAGVKLRRIALIMAPPFVVQATAALLTHLAGHGAAQATAVLSAGDSFLALVRYMDRFALNVPDLWAFFMVFFVTLPVLGPGVWRAMRREPTAAEDRDAGTRANLVLGCAGILVVQFVVFFTVVLPLVYRFPFVLPRYSVMVAPFLLLWLGNAAAHFLSAQTRWASVGCFLLLAVFFAVNANGVLYPTDVDTDGPGNDFALTERSNAYRRLLALERQAVKAAQALPAGVPVYYGQYEHYLFNYPGLGFAAAPLPNGHNLYLEPLGDLSREKAPPPCVYALYNYPWLGGDRIRSMLAQAKNSADYSSDVIQEFRDGRYVIKLVRVRKVGAACPP